jgi:hypothetical protein
MTLATAEFIRRFLIHVLPHGFHRIRHYGLLASGTRADNIAQARRLLHASTARPKAADTTRAETEQPKPRRSSAAPRRTPSRGIHRGDQDRHIMIRLG